MIARHFFIDEMDVIRNNAFRIRHKTPEMAATDNYDGGRAQSNTKVCWTGIITYRYSGIFEYVNQFRKASFPRQVGYVGVICMSS